MRPAALDLSNKVLIMVVGKLLWRTPRMKLPSFRPCLVLAILPLRKFVNMKLLIFHIDRGALIVFEDAASLYHIDN